MRFKDRVSKAVKAVKSEAVIAKASHDSSKSGHKPDDYEAAFKPEDKPQAVSKSAYQKWREREVNGD